MLAITNTMNKIPPPSAAYRSHFNESSMLPPAIRACSSESSHSGQCEHNRRPGQASPSTDLTDSRGVAELLGLAQPNTVSGYQRRYPGMPRPVVNMGQG